MRALDRQVRDTTHCPRCLSAPGVECVTTSGRPAVLCHLDRYKAWHTLNTVTR